MENKTVEQGSQKKKKSLFLRILGWVAAILCVGFLYSAGSDYYDSQDFKHRSYAAAALLDAYPMSIVEPSYRRYKVSDNNERLKAYYAINNEGLVERRYDTSRIDPAYLEALVKVYNEVDCGGKDVLYGGEDALYGGKDALTYDDFLHDLKTFDPNCPEYNKASKGEKYKTQLSIDRITSWLMKGRDIRHYVWHYDSKTDEFFAEGTFGSACFDMIEARYRDARYLPLYADYPLSQRAQETRGDA